MTKALQAEHGAAPGRHRWAWPIAALHLPAIALGTWLLLPSWRQNPDLSHGLFAPIVFVLLLWRSRVDGTQRWLEPGPFRVGLQALASLLALGLFVLAALLAVSVGWSQALVCFLSTAALSSLLLAGLVVLAGSETRLIPFNWISVTAVCSWVLVSPLPPGTYTTLTVGLQSWVSTAVVNALQLLGIPALQRGNIIELATTSVGVEEACSGVRSLLSCTYVAIMLSAWSLRALRARLALIALGPLIALVLNFVRSLSLTLMVQSGLNIGGFWHDATGYAVLLLAAATLTLLATWWETAPNDEAPRPPSPPTTARTAWGHGLFLATWVVAAALVAATFLLARRPGAPQAAPPDLAALLPTSFPGWDVRTATDLDQFAGTLQTSHMVQRTYLRAHGKAVRQMTVYVAYWPAASVPVSMVAMHTPDICWPGNGWSRLEPPARRPDFRVVQHALPAPAEHAFINGNGLVQNVWSWHLSGGRVLPQRNPLSVRAQFRLAVEEGFRRPEDQYFIRISSNQEWAELADEALVRQIIGQLSSLGL